MKKYRCKICGHIYDDAKEKIKFEDLPDDWTCPLCGVPKSMFEEVIEETPTEKDPDDNRVWISEDNPSIARIEEKCIHCGMCKNTCRNITEIMYDKAKVSAPICVHCGQCILTCPTGALVPKYDYKKVLNYLKDTDYTVIVSTSPAVRVALGDEFGMEPGAFVEGKMVAALKELGFSYVLDTTFGADLTIMEEAQELIERVQKKKNLPQFTSCCPAWVKYAEMYHPEILPNISSTKSPISIQSAIIRTYFTRMYELDPNKIITVALVPCTAKKYEIKRSELSSMDYCITTTELAMMVRECNINFKELKEKEYDSILSKGSGAGVIFGNSGGVMEAALRTAYFFLTNQKAPDNFYALSEVRGLDGIKTATIDLAGIPIKVAAVAGLKNIEQLLPTMKDYTFIEVMNCPGGCVGGGGQPLVAVGKLESFREARIKSLYQNDAELNIRNSYDNPDIIKIYESFLECPNSKLAEELLHTVYEDKSHLVKEKQTI